MQEYYFNKNEIYYRKNEFLPNRLTLVFVHGVSGSSSAWLPYEKIFENKYNVLTYDIRGHGLSKKYPKYADYKIENFAKDLHNLVTHLNISKFVLISNSFGGLVALEYIKNWSESVIANIFTSPEIYFYKNFFTKIVSFILNILVTILSLFSFSLRPHGRIDYKKYAGSTDWSIKRNLTDMANTTLHVHFFTLRQSFTHNQECSTENIKSPTLIIHGQKDSMVPLKNAVVLSEKIENSELVTVPNIDHNTVHNAVKEMSEAIESFIKKKNLIE